MLRRKTVKKLLSEGYNKDKNVEVEFMTLLERDREKIEEGRQEGIELTKKVFKLHASKYSIEEIAKKCEISKEKLMKILE